MKKYTSFPAIFLALVLTLSPAALCAGDEPEAPFSVTAESAILVEAATGEVLYEMNADAPRYPASITKVMTGLLTVEAALRGDISLDDQVTLGEDIYTGIGSDGSTLNLQPGEELTVRDLLYAALLPSANEACNALATVVAGDIPTFVDRMNQRAAELGMTGTHYTNTHGYHDDDHYTTARDVSYLCQAALAIPEFKAVVSSATYTIPETNLSKERNLKDTNALVSNVVEGYRYKYAIGVKTGYTSKAGRCLASAAEKDHRVVIAVLLGGKDWYSKEGVVPDNYFVESRRMLEYGFNNFSQKTILDTIEPIDTIPVSLCKEQDYITVHPAAKLEATLPNDLDPALFTRTVTLPETLEAPIQKGEVLGSITLSYEGRDYGTVDLVAANSLERSSFLVFVQQLKTLFSNLWFKLLLLVVILLILLLILRRVVLGPSHRKRRRSSQPGVYSSSYRGRKR